MPKTSKQDIINIIIKYAGIFLGSSITGLVGIQKYRKDQLIVISKHYKKMACLKQTYNVITEIWHTGMNKLLERA